MTTIRPALAADVDQITDIYNALLETTTYEWTETRHTVTEVARWLADQEADDWPVLVAVDGDRVVGWATYGDFRDSRSRPGYRFTVEHSIHIRQDSWGRGTGRALMARLAEHANRAGKRVLVAAIDASNEPSMAFHARLGFTEVARMPGVGEKWGKRLDLVLMQHDVGELARSTDEVG